MADAVVKQPTDVVNTPEEQRELFLWKFRDVKREDVMVLYRQFIQADKDRKGQIAEFEAMKMFERRGSIKTAVDLRKLVEAMDINHNHQLSLLEWLCAHFKKDFNELYNFVDEEARARAIEEAMRWGEEMQKAQEEIEIAQKRKEMQAQIRAQALEKESKLKGVEGMRAFFLRKVESASDVTKTNEQQIKEEAARRRALREAKRGLLQAQESMNKVKTAEEIAAEVKAEAARKAAEEEAAKKKAVEDELAARAARKAALNAKWGGGGQASTPPKPK